MKIISGGQTGADRAALEAAKLVGIETGGYAPKNYLTEDGSDYTLKEFGLIDSRLDYVGRTNLNVQHSDLTLWFGNEDTKGFFATKRACKNFNKEFYDVTNLTPESIFNIIKNFKIINIAGNRHSMNEDVGSIVFHTLTTALRMCL